MLNIKQVKFIIVAHRKKEVITMYNKKAIKIIVDLNFSFRPWGKNIASKDQNRHFNFDCLSITKTAI